MAQSIWSSKTSLLLALMLAYAPIAGAQVVVGRVLQRGTDAVIEDASVFVGDVVGTRGRTVRSSSQGKFRVKLDAPGSLVVRVRRIGFRPFESSVLRVAKGDSVTVDAELDPVPQELAAVMVNAELEAIKDIKIRGYNARSMPATFITPSQIDAAGKDAHNYLDIMQNLRLLFVRIDPICVRPLSKPKCLPVYLNDMLLADDPDEIKATRFVVDPNAIDHIVLVHDGALAGTMHIYTRDYTNRQRRAVKPPRSK